MNFLALGILMLFCLVGFAAIFFTTFGTLIILAGIILYAALTGFSVLGLRPLVIVIILYILGESLEYILVIAGAKKFGASTSSALGGLIGGIAGASIGSLVFGVGIIPGTFIGIFLGALTVELILKRDFIKSFKAGSGALSGRLGSILAKVIIAIIMFGVVLFEISSASGEEGPLYKGMPRQDLKKAGYLEEKTLGHYAYRDREFLVFSDWTTADFKDIITFVIKDDRVIDWFRGYRDDILEKE